MPNQYPKAAKIRGVHVPHRKNTRDTDTVALSSSVVTIPLSMHIGAPAEPVVAKGDRVFVGTLIGRATSFISANIHSSVSGTVKDSVKILFPDGQYKDALVIESDGTDTPDPALHAPSVSDRDSFIAAVKESGLVGLGGAGFPTHVKLMPPKNNAIDTLVINVAECEPYITSDFREIMEYPDNVIGGLRSVMKYLDINNVVFGVEDNKPEAIKMLSERTADIAGVRVQPLPSVYPQGAEKTLIANTVHRAVPIGKLPSDVGCIVLNVGSLSFMDKYLHTGMPLVRRRITVDGGAVKSPGNYMIPIGMKISEIIAASGGYADECRELLMGGPMMGTSLYTDDFPVLKNNNAIIALTKDEMYELPINPCIHCGRCARNCPMRLSPVEIAAAYDAGDLELAQKMSAMACIECGSCTFVCPAKRPVTQRMRTVKIAIRKAGKK